MPPRSGVAESGLPDAATGLTAAEVDDRRRRGLVNDVPRAPTRTWAQIVRANVVTRFNVVVGSLFAVICVVGPLRDGLFAGVIVANSLIGIVQELRAKRTLDRLAVLNAPQARVVRDGAVALHPVGDVVLDDVLELLPGDQVPVDATVLAAERLEVDESLLTGEADPVVKEVGDEVLSGSFVVAGRGRVRAARVGAEAYAARLAEEARRFTLSHSELRRGIDRIVTYATWGLVPTAVLLVVSQLRAGEGWEQAARASVGGVVAMVPEGLVLLTSMAFAVGVVRLARRRTLVQELPAIEMLARVDVLCVDKTGTITTGDIALRTVVPLAGTPEDPAVLASALAALAAAEPDPNATLAGVRRAHPEPPGWSVTAAVAFSSARKWSGASFAGHGTWLLGAPDVLAPGDTAVADALVPHAAAGRRVLLLATHPTPLVDDALPTGVTPVALVVMEDTLRPDAPETFAFFARQGVTIKVISGDHPTTVAAVAARAGIPGAERAVDARTLPHPDTPAGAAALADALDAATVFGRVTPQQKRAMVVALQAHGHTVAMTGDGVNDVLALKEADIGVAMGSGSAASRAVAQLVLLDSSFAAMPAAVAEGRRAINNLERVASLFVQKTVYAFALALLTGVLTVPYPFLPRHLTLVGSLTIGIPAFLLALGPNEELARPGFVRRVLELAVPAGLASAVAVFGGYAVARNVLDVTGPPLRTLAACCLAAAGLALLAWVARPLRAWKLAVVLAMAGVFATVLVVPPLREFFDLELPGAPWVTAGAVVASAALMLATVAGAGAAFRAPRRAAAR